MLTEDQIQRFSRQILLREVGGLGQERLLSTAIAVEGQGAVFELVRQLLYMGGSPVEVRGRYRVTSPQLAADVSVGPRSVAAGCNSCVAAFKHPAAAGDPTLTVMIASVATLSVQRLVLGIGEAFWACEWSGEQLLVTHPKCPHSP